MIDKKGLIRCDVCKKVIEKLIKDKYDEDLEGHGWSNWQTAKMHGCYACGNKHTRFGCPFIYETYFAGTYKDMPNGERHVYVHSDKTYFIRGKERMEGVAVELPPNP